MSRLALDHSRISYRKPENSPNETAIQEWRSHRNIQHITHYTELTIPPVQELLAVKELKPDRPAAGELLAVA